MTTKASTNFEQQFCRVMGNEMLTLLSSHRGMLNSNQNSKFSCANKSRAENHSGLNQNIKMENELKRTKEL